MQFTRIISFLTFFLTLGALTIASPAPAGFDLEARASSQGGDKTTAIINVLTPLQTKCGVTLIEIKSVSGHKNATVGTVEPILASLVSEIEVVIHSLTSISNVSLGNSVNATELAQLVAEITQVVEEIASEVGTILGTFEGLILVEILSGLDVQYSGLLSEVQSLVANILSIVVSLLGSLFNLTPGILSGSGLVLCARLL